MERFVNNRFFIILIYILLIMAALFMLLQIKPMIIGIYNFISAVLAPFIIAMIISYVLNPIVNLLSIRKVPRTLAVLLIYAVFITSITVILMNLIPMFMKQVKELNEHLPELTATVQKWLDYVYENRFFPESVRLGVTNSLMNFENNIGKEVSQLISDIGSYINMMFLAFIVPFLAFYMLKDFKLIEKGSLAIIPSKHRKQTVRLLINIDEALGNYIRGQFLVCVVVGILAYIGYWVIGMPYALLLASVVAVFNIIPYLGPFFGAAPAIIMAATISFKMVLFVAIVNIIVQILEGNVISPQIVGRTLHLHPMSIIFALLVGGELAGVVGLILAVPVFAVMKVIVHHVFDYYVQRKKT
ncbi:AI-2E family transporter [Chengkuizengella sp. SCS-71B]|uniref:AI-2E family transporter n=1 Tax=Chengkuizengella sp. SCS-71B TaxID=3115290 RepID=UPI0032C22809